MAHDPFQNTHLQTGSDLPDVRRDWVVAGDKPTPNGDAVGYQGRGDRIAVIADIARSRRDWEAKPGAPSGIDVG